MEQKQPKRNVITVVGIGADGLDGLPLKTQQIIHQAQHIFGGERHLSMVRGLDAELHPWPKPFLTAIDQLKRLRHRSIVVLASGDPMHYGVGVTLHRYFAADDLCVIPHPSAFSLAAARLAWPLQDVKCLSLLGVPIDIIPHLQSGAKIFALASDKTTPWKICQQLCAAGFAMSRVYILENLGGNHERVRDCVASEHSHASKDDLSDLFTLAVECQSSSVATKFPLTSLPDTVFEHDGQLTKQDVRALTMARLAPRDGETLWDIGAGCGSITIEWLRSGRSMNAYAFERNGKRAHLIANNARKIGVTNFQIILGDVPQTLTVPDAPDAIFIGGGLTSHDTLDQSWLALKHGGRLVANAVTVEAEALLLRFAMEHDGRLTKVALSEMDELGRFSVWRPALPITTMVCIKA